MTVPLVTIGLTCFNASDTVARAISSALAQDWPNIELLIVDDRQ
jgi:glycosyltransferase involved in cell wall biosynthesis